jgi:hypothetical protein
VVDICGRTHVLDVVAQGVREQRPAGSEKRAISTVRRPETIRHNKRVTATQAAIQVDG